MGSTRRAMIAILLASSLGAGCGQEDTASRVEGRWGGPGGATVELMSDGTAEGNDGCNDIVAAWEPVSDTTGRFVVSESTEIGCSDVAGWGDASAYVLVGDTLIIESGDGEDLTQLTRSMAR